MAWEERGWRIMRRVRRGMRRPGARHSFDCGDYEEQLYPRYYAVASEDSPVDRYLASKCPDPYMYNIYERRHILTTLEGLPERQLRRIRGARDLAPDGSYLPKRLECQLWPSYRNSALWVDIGCAVLYVFCWWRSYVKDRMCYIRLWFGDDYDDYEHIPTPEQQRQFEKDAWYWDQYHWRVLAARRRVARLLVLTILRSAAKQRAIALYWQEQTQRALCAPGGAGRAADRGAFESEFA